MESRSPDGVAEPVKVLAFGTYDVRSHPRIGVLIDGLRANGDEVVEVNLPLGIDTARRVAMLRQPWRLPRLAWRLVRCWSALTVRGRRASRQHRPDVVVVGYLGHFDVQLARLLFGRSIIALDHLIFAADTARDRGETTSWKLRVLRRLDTHALRAADLVIMDTDEHAAMLPAERADRAVVVPVGAAQAWFTAADANRQAPAGRPIRVVFFGLYTPLQGTPVIGQALALLADEPVIQITMIGIGQDHDEARRLAADSPQVEWLDWVPSGALPELVADKDVCLGIFADVPKALRVVPNKVYQGAAAGCAIVTSNTRPQRTALGAAARYVPPGDPHALAEALRELAEDRDELARLQQAAQDRARAAFTPPAIVRPLRAWLAGAPGRRADRDGGQAPGGPMSR
jgi:glycosyltransferase involved in cell wall biosynthesis